MLTLASHAGGTFKDLLVVLTEEDVPPGIVWFGILFIRVQVRVGLVCLADGFSFGRGDGVCELSFFRGHSSGRGGDGSAHGRGDTEEEEASAAVAREDDF